MAVELSVVIPVHNEAPALDELHRELTETLRAWGRPYEIIIVDDGSTDDSFEILARLQALDPFRRTIRVILDLMTVKFLLSYSTRPLQIFGLIGGVMGVIGVAISGWLAFEKLRHFDTYSLSNRPLLLLGILLIFTGVQLVTLGLLAELQARTYHESQNKPTYAIREILQAPPVERARVGR